MLTAPGTPFHYEIEETRDENDSNVTVVKCRGRLLGKNTTEIREVVEPLILRGGRIAEGIGEPQNPSEAYFWHSVGMEFCEYHWDCEGFVDAAADHEILAAKLPQGLVNEDSSLHKRAKDWIHAHCAFLPKGNLQNGDCSDDEFDAIDDEQDDADEE